MTSYQIWSEGYSITGSRCCAFLVGEVEADSFKEAVAKLKDSLPEDEAQYILLESLTCPGYSSYWGCRLFDNEEDARASFG